jgi:GntR family transcriptional regulator of arabinose operon
MYMHFGDPTQAAGDAYLATLRHTTSKHAKICEHVREGIASGLYRIDQRIPTEAELARRFGACRQTVSQALRQLEQQGLLTRRRGAGTFVRRRTSTTNNVFGLLLAGAYSGIFAPICARMARVARTKGYSLVVEDAPSEDADDQALIRGTEELCREYVERGVAGVFFAPLMLPRHQMEVNVHIAEALDRAGIPVVLLDRDIYDYPQRSRFDLVGVANRRASQTLTNHLWDLGYRRIEYITHLGEVSTVTARIAGCMDVLQNHGITPDPKWVHQGNVRDIAFLREVMRDSRAEAFVCANDHVAARVMRHLATLGIRVPDDVAIVGFDDVDYATLVLVPLTTMRQPCARIGEMAVRLMVERLADPGLPAREVSFDCEMVVRESCGAALRGNVAHAVG